MGTYYGLVMPQVYTGGVYIKSIRQTKTSTESGGKNIITATLTNHTQQTFEIYNGQKGDKGDTGKAANIKKITATVANSIGTPQVTVSETGDGSDKTVAFEFSGLKGEKGDKGERGLKGDKGDRGERGEKGDMPSLANYIPNAMKDYRDPRRTIQLGFAGNGLTAATTSHLTGFYFDGKNDRGFKIRDISKEETLKFLKLTQKNIIDMIYPIGTVYLTMDGKDPKELFPGTKWKRISEGRFLSGVGAGKDTKDISWYIEPGQGIGEYLHTLTIDEIPTHRHEVAVCNDGNPNGKRDRSSGADCQYWNTQDNRTNVSYNTPPNTKYTGRGLAHNNMPPYFGVFVWQRIA